MQQFWISQEFLEITPKIPWNVFKIKYISVFQGLTEELRKNFGNILQSFSKRSGANFVKILNGFYGDSSDFRRALHLWEILEKNWWDFNNPRKILTINFRKNSQFCEKLKENFDETLEKLLEIFRKILNFTDSRLILAHMGIQYYKPTGMAVDFRTCCSLPLDSS